MYLCAQPFTPARCNKLLQRRIWRWHWCAKKLMLSTRSGIYLSDFCPVLLIVGFFQRWPQLKKGRVRDEILTSRPFLCLRSVLLNVLDCYRISLVFFPVSCAAKCGQSIPWTSHSWALFDYLCKRKQVLEIGWASVWKRPLQLFVDQRKERLLIGGLCIVTC